MNRLRLGHARWQLFLASSPQLAIAYISNRPPAAPGSPKTPAQLETDPSVLSLAPTSSAAQPPPHHPSRALLRHRITREGRVLTKPLSL